jgi:hypothetical protein
VRFKPDPRVGGWGVRAKSTARNTPPSWLSTPPAEIARFTRLLQCAAAAFPTPVTCGNTGMRSASVVSGKMPTMKAAERERRNAQVLQLFLGGASHRTLARAVGLRSHRSVGNIVSAALGSTTDRRDLLTDEASSTCRTAVRFFRAYGRPVLTRVELDAEQMTPKKWKSCRAHRHPQPCRRSG